MKNLYQSLMIYQYLKLVKIIIKKYYKLYLIELNYNKSYDNNIFLFIIMNFKIIYSKL
jgi:hypothetical protein